MKQDADIKLIDFWATINHTYYSNFSERKRARVRRVLFFIRDRVKWITPMYIHNNVASDHRYGMQSRVYKCI